MALPGTPDASGRLTGRPGGAGTGWVLFERFRDTSWGELLRTRFVERCASVAERHWNLSCRLLANGIGAPEPLVVAAQGRGLVARRSFLVTRELQGFLPFERYAAAHPSFEERRCALDALRAMRTRLASAGIVLRDLAASPPCLASGDGASAGSPAAGEACLGEERGDDACASHEDGVPADFVRRALPTVAFADVGGLALRASAGGPFEAWLQAQESALSQATVPSR